MSSMNEYRGVSGTKFKLVTAVLVIGTVMLIVGKLTGDQWVTGVIGLVGSYILGDVGGRFAEAKK